jgi:carotenoid cleavage dioxygenase
LLSWWSHLNISGPRAKGCVTRARIDSNAASVHLEVLDDRPTEFPRVDDRRQGRPTRYIRFDLSRGTNEIPSFHGSAIGEAVFAPKVGRDEEEAGYILTFATNLATMESTFVILDAENFAGERAAVVKLPRRVPLGLHGNWYPAEP